MLAVPLSVQEREKRNVYNLNFPGAQLVTDWNQMMSILSKWNKTGGVTVLNLNLAQLRTLISLRNSLSMLWVLYLADHSNSQSLFYEGIHKKIHWTHVHWHGTCENTDRPKGLPRLLHKTTPHLLLLLSELCSYLDQGLVSFVWYLLNRAMKLF